MSTVVFWQETQYWPVEFHHRLGGTYNLRGSEDLCLPPELLLVPEDGGSASFQSDGELSLHYTATGILLTYIN
jgi:hypothetical protein